MRKCRIISGDVSQDDLGLSPEDRLLLQDEVNFIYHSAASTRFDDCVKTAVCFNTRSTKLLLDLAHQCKNLEVFVHLSTAYAFPEEKVLYEKVYKPSVDVHHVLAVVNRGREEECEAYGYRDDCPNTYIFSKTLAEQLVVEQMDTLPVIITRPSVVCPTFREPLPGWGNNLQGPMGLFVGARKGIIRCMYMKGDCYVDFGMTPWEEIIEMGKDIIYNDVPFNGVVWYPGGPIKKSRFVHNVCFFLFQVLPAIFIDALLIVLGYKPILCQIQKRIYKSSEVFEYYTTKAWNFSNLKADELRARQNKIEREKYQTDDEGVDVREYFKKGCYQ
ncbi:NAD binding 4 and/or Sterile domain containing protein [Asbolus verrucosus]|uniref:Fatty acyl-CoA reductase n=1 Tax=Asbolus verrucosus TaxID=1661398 RepID=A0A482W7K3_ASBVE|nr:NAD binding 4 and/or Sterile domain containing protein [Asbolus verrucosus]